MLYHAYYYASFCLAVCVIGTETTTLDSSLCNILLCRRQKFLLVGCPPRGLTKRWPSWPASVTLMSPWGDMEWRLSYKPLILQSFNVRCPRIPSRSHYRHFSCVGEIISKSSVMDRSCRSGFHWKSFKGQPTYHREILNLQLSGAVSHTYTVQDSKSASIGSLNSWGNVSRVLFLR